MTKSNPALTSNPLNVSEQTTPRWPAGLTVGWVLFAVYFLVIPAVVPARSTGRWDHIIALEQLLWIAPLLILIPALAISTLRMKDLSRIGTVAAWTLILLFTAASCWMWINYGTLLEQLWAIES